MTSMTARRAHGAPLKRRLEMNLQDVDDLTDDLADWLDDQHVDMPTAVMALVKFLGVVMCHRKTPAEFENAVVLFNDGFRAIAEDIFESRGIKIPDSKAAN